MSKNRSSALKRDREQRKAEKLQNKRRRREERKQGLLPSEPTEPRLEDESPTPSSPPIAGPTAGPSQ